MKYIFLAVIALLGTLALSGCDDRNDVEVALFKQCSAINKIDCKTEYESTIISLDCGGALCNPNETPFARSFDVFKIDDKMFKNAHPEMKSISEIYYTSTGRVLYSSDYQKGNSTDEVKRVDNRYILSPQMYDELISSVKTCNRATIASTQFTMGSTLSPEDYDKVMSIIIDCKKYQLEDAINKK